MEIAEEKRYAIGNGNICVHRHFGKRELTGEVIRDGVLQAAREAELLTGEAPNGIIQLSLREPQ